MSGTNNGQFREKVTVHVGDRRLVCPADRLSVTGIRLYSPVREEAGRFMRLSFTLDRVGLLVVDGYLISAVKVRDHYIWNVQFHNVHARIAEKLVCWAEGGHAPVSRPGEAAPDGPTAPAAIQQKRTTQKLPTVAREPVWRQEQRASSEAETEPSLPAVLMSPGPRPGEDREPVFFESDTTPVG